MACAPSGDSDHPWHPPSLIRVFAVRMKKPWVLSYTLSAQSDLSLRWKHMPFCWFCRALAQITTHPIHQRKKSFNIGIKHGCSCINICQVPKEVLKTEAGGRGFQHLPRDLANVNAVKNHVRSLLLHKN